MDNVLKVEMQSDTSFKASADIERSIFDLDTQIDMLSSHADNLDCLVAIASGLLCGTLDVLWVEAFDLSEGKSIADSKVDDFVNKTAKMMGCEDGDIKESVKYLEKMFPIPSDGNTPDFGGGLQHHLRDFGHHPTIMGLMTTLGSNPGKKKYTTFTQEMGAISEDNGTISFDVTVTNTGDVAGKDVVEVYYNPPYTNGGIEKASANLIQFEKTEVLQPGDSQTYTVASTVTYDESNPRSTDETAAVNEFAYAEGDVTYLSRADGFANYAEATAAPASMSTSDEAKATFLNNSNYNPEDYNNDSDEMPTTGANNGVKLADLRGVDYDDAQWDSLLDELADHGNRDRCDLCSTHHLLRSTCNQRLQERSGSTSCCTSRSS